MDIFNQKDSIWSKIKIGNTTIGAHGCLVSCLASLATYYGKRETPKTIVSGLKFDSQAYYYWRGLSNLYPDIKLSERVHCETKPAPIQKIDKLVKEGYPILIDTRYRKKFMHWVLLWKVIKGKHLIVDPLHGDVAFFEDRYGNFSRWCYGYAVYKGNVTDYPNQIKKLCNDIIKISKEFKNKRSTY